MSEQIFVIAGTYRQAVEWGRQHGVPARDIVYLATPDHHTTSERGTAVVGTEELHAIVRFVTACLAEDEQIARDAGFSLQSKTRQREWTAHPTEWPGGERPFLDGVKVTDRVGIAVFIANGASRALHAARHDPADVLARIAATRAAVALHGTYDTDPCLKLEDGAWWNPELYGPCNTLRLLVSGFAARPGYEQAWGVIGP